MATLPIGIATRSLRLPLRQALLKAAQLGADGVEIDVRNELRLTEMSQTAVRQLKKLLSDLGLKVAAVAFPTRRGYDDPDELDRRVLATQEAMSLAYRLGASVVVNQAGALPADADTPLAENQVNALSLLAAHSERAGARLALVSDAAPASQRRLLDELPGGGIGVALDPIALLSAGHAPTEALTQLGEHLLYGYAIDAVHEGIGSGARTSEVELGRGDADWPELLGLLEERGYRGWLTALRSAGSDPAGDLANAVAYLRTL
ncbi:sugar phosphate isomerase/epimerase family protein [Botrimarina hoheduenensis]|uniref:Xylose isomerase-like TIM barrel n=1 Tax=Botrimarina hoheduenensis TaxID=2528000 RepID=A0A5C5WAN4_9BACT|nr:sugar phosphate isomerase/epimerase family protein [Botrimarina hoheduenensis]TWT46662.1 Xylose isomerase-like TIM barrel [Botrimarina hoheduenensis]